MARKKSNKRERLVEAALAVFYLKGVARSTLADVAERAEVKLGNVYYYFKTKEELLAAVVELHRERLVDGFAHIETQHTEPLERVVAFLVGRLQFAQMMSIYGCPHGGLSHETRKSGVPEISGAASLVPVYIHWLEAQFVALGAQDAHDWAFEVFVVVQGSVLAAQAYGSSEPMQIQLDRLETRLRERWGEV